MKYLILLSLCSLSLLAGKVPQSGELKYAAIFVRHGARSPLSPQTVLDRRMTWPMGYGQLTPLGQRQLYLLGSAFRKHYINQLGFLSPSYNESELGAWSTNYGRTLMSMNSLLLGLYPGGLKKMTERQMIDESLWTPPFQLTVPEEVKDELQDSSLPFDIPVIPILSFNQTYDNVMEFASCPKYEGFWDIYFESERFAELRRRHEATFKTVCELLGLDISRLKGDELYYLLDYVLTAELHGKLAGLTGMPEMLKELRQFFTQIMMEVVSSDPWMTSVAMTNFSQELPATFENIIKNTYRGKKLNLFLTHDMVIIAYLLGLGVSPSSDIFHNVPFASHIIVELRKNENEYYVNVTYNGEQLRLEPFGEFRKAMESIKKLPRPWDEECKLTNLIPVLPNTYATDT